MADSILDAGLLAMVVSTANGVFTAPSFDNFLALAAGWVLCRTRRTTTGLIVAAGAHSPAAARRGAYPALQRGPQVRIWPSMRLRLPGRQGHQAVSRMPVPP